MSSYCFTLTFFFSSYFFVGYLFFVSFVSFISSFFFLLHLYFLLFHPSSRFSREFRELYAKTVTYGDGWTLTALKSRDGWNERKHEKANKEKEREKKFPISICTYVFLFFFYLARLPSGTLYPFL